MPPPVPLALQLTLAQAIVLADKQSPQNLQATYQVASSRANLSSQRAPLNPTLGYSGINNTVGTGNFGNPDNYALYGTVETSGRQGLRTRQAKAQLQGAQFDAQTTHLTVQQATAGAYITLQVADINLASERIAYDVANRLRDLTEQQFKLGAAPETNAIRARIAQTQEEQNLLQAINNVNTARANLNIQLGRSPDTPVDAADPLNFRPINLKLQELQDLALRSRPEVRSAEAGRHALQAVVGLEHSQYFPDTIVGTTLRFQEVQLGFVFPLDLGSIRGAVQRAREDVHAQEAQEAQVRLQVQSDVKSAYLALELAQRTVETYQDGIVPRSKSLLDRIEQGYKLGASTILDLIDAQETYRTTVNAYNNSLGDYRQALAQLERAVGKKVAQ
jgi:cobalt-zinc-cadmium efflux system outer membrane protein